jgi:hypothetical protein
MVPKDLEATYIVIREHVGFKAVSSYAEEQTSARRHSYLHPYTHGMFGHFPADTLQYWITGTWYPIECFAGDGNKCVSDGFPRATESKQIRANDLPARLRSHCHRIPTRKYVSTHALSCEADSRSHLTSAAT